MVTGPVAAGLGTGESCVPNPPNISALIRRTASAIGTATYVAMRAALGRP
jgi:hypothetical protein